MRTRLTIAFVLVALRAITSAQSPIVIGLVREDGYLIPIARITARLIEAPATRQSTIEGDPLKLNAPAWPLKGLSWTLSDGRGLKPLEITTLGQAIAPMPYCSDRLLWRTSLKRPPARKGYAPIRKIGAAVSGGSLEFPENIANQPDEASRRIARRIVSLFLSKERSRLAEEKGHFAVSAGHGAPPVRIQQLKRHVVGGVTTYYFEATKALKLSDTSIAPDAGLVTGWIVDSATGLKDYEVIYKVNDDSYKQNDRASVRGIVPFQGRALWLLEWHGWESEYYTLHDWPSGILRLTVDAYECEGSDV